MSTSEIINRAATLGISQLPQSDLDELPNFQAKLPMYTERALIVASQMLQSAPSTGRRLQTSDVPVFVAIISGIVCGALGTFASGGNFYAGIAAYTTCSGAVMAAQLPVPTGHAGIQLEHESYAEIQQHPVVPNPQVGVRPQYSEGPWPTTALDYPVASIRRSPTGVPVLHSRPPGQCKYSAFLDFNGYPLTTWPKYPKGYVKTPRFSEDNDEAFSESEQQMIVAIWRAVVEDYAIVDLDVTTEKPEKLEWVEVIPTVGQWAQSYVRMIIGGDGSWHPGTGVAR